MDFELDLQGWPHWNRVVSRSYPFYSYVCYYGDGYDELIPREP